MADPKEIVALIQLGREDRFLEYKQSRPWNDLKRKIARTAMGMANKRDGGTIIIGVSQYSGVFSTDGMEAAHMATYDEDTIRAYINSYADPYVNIEKHEREVNGKKFLALVVYEFEDIPAICRRDSGTELREGAVYCRSYRMPETTEVRSQTEMREIVSMAIEKGLRSYLQTSQRVGIPLEEIARRAGASEYDNELGGL